MRPSARAVFWSTWLSRSSTWLSSTPGIELPLRMLLAFRASLDDAQHQLRRQGHPDIQPAHVFVLRAIGGAGTTAGELATRLAISKQAAAKTIAALEQHGYVRRTPDPGDGRRKLIRLTGRGVDCLARALTIYDAQRARWARELGAERIDALEQDLARMTPAGRAATTADPTRRA